MNTINAIVMGQATKNDPVKVFDWDKAAKLIKEHKAEEAYAGLRSDLEYTGGRILEGGIPDKDGYTYLASTWAIPVLILGGNLYGEEIECWIYKHDKPEWDSDTKWPESAIEIITS